MSEHEQQQFDALRAEAWSEFIYPRTAVANLAEPPVDCGFIRAARVYERELDALTSANEASDRDYVAEMRVVSNARDIAYEMLDQLVNSCPERTDVERIVAELDKVLGPDLVREADPTGQVVKSLPFDERKRILDAMVESPLKPEYVRAVRAARELAEERGINEPPLILIVEDEFPKIFPVKDAGQGEGE